MMKLLSILSLILVAGLAQAQDPNYDTATRVVTIPRVTIDHDATFVDVRLLLRANGTWAVLSGTPAPSVAPRSGAWSGSGSSDAYPGCSARIEGTITIDGNALNGEGSLDGNCAGFGRGRISGTIDGNEIHFGIAASNGTTIFFDGQVSDDGNRLSGQYEWPSRGDHGNWSLERNH